MRFLRRLLNLKAVFLLFFLPAFAASAWLLPTLLPVALPAGHALSAIAALRASAPGNTADLADGARRLALEQPSRYPVSFLNDRARDITGATAVNAAGFVVPEGLTGEGQIVAIADSGLDMGRTDDIHPDLRSSPGKMPKVVLLRSWTDREVPDDPDGHGTHMAATIAGTGAASNGKFRGVAPGASIYFQSILNKEGDPELPANLADLFWPAYSAGARVHVNGWGGGPNSYMESAAQVDDFVRKQPDFLVVFGAGNDGPSARSITAEANSKNALAVGASVLPRPAFVPGEGDTSLPADFSSRGPAGDGRIKPEILAPGSAVISARSRQVEGNLPGYPDYTRLQGTSMAAAVAGGSATLLREYLKKYEKLPTPSAALVKAALINGSRPAEGGPSQEGFGVLDLAGTIIALKEGTFNLADQWAEVAQGEETLYTFRVTDSSAPFKATLAWTDPPTGAGDPQVLVNDLDLIVRTPDGKVYYGNHFLGKNGPDRTNNLEQVYLPTPVPGDYTVRVSGTAVRQNTVYGSSAALQDYALVWGQPPAGSLVQKADSRSIATEDGASIRLGSLPVVNLVNDQLAPADASHLFPGAAVYRTPQRLYLMARLWRAAGVRSIETAEGTILTEMNPSIRLGGYALTAGDGRILLNNSPVSTERLPPGIEISAVINPYDQIARDVKAASIEQEGAVEAVFQQGGQKAILLAGTGKSYRISRDAVYSYEDNYDEVETEDMPFGTGALEELEELLPGMPVRLSVSPSSGEVQYLAVERWVTLGTVAGTTPAGDSMVLESGAPMRLFPGAPVKRDREFSSLSKIRPGDHVTAALLPDTGEAIGVIAYSSVIYGKTIDYTRKKRTLYLLDDSGRYQALYLPPEAILYRWGVRATADALSPGSRVRITTDPSGKEVWRLDIADTFKDQDRLVGYRGGSDPLLAGEDRWFRVAGATRFYKNGFRVTPEDFLPGEVLDVEYAIAPQPTGNVLISASARSVAQSPSLRFSAVLLQGRLVVTGVAEPGISLCVWGKEGAREEIPLDASGRFQFSMRQDVEGYHFTLVAVDRRTGGIAGRQLALAGSWPGDQAGAVVNDALSGAITGSRLGALPDRTSISFRPDLPLARAEAVGALAELLHWSSAGEQVLSFEDARDISVPFRSAVSEAWARKIIKGYPGGDFRPTFALSRAEAAVILSAVLRDLGLKVKAQAALAFSDAEDIPPWAAQGVAEASSAGLFPNRPSLAFAPDEPVTAGEMAAVLGRLLEYCEYMYQNVSH